MMIRVYIVEDNQHLLEDTLFCLNNEYLNCYGAHDATGLQNLLNEQSANVIVLDWMLPGKDGLTIANELRSHPDYAQLGIVFLTARSALEDRLSGLDVADAYLVKPIDYRELSAVIQSVSRRLTLPPVLNNPSHPDRWFLYSKALRLISPNGDLVLLSERENQILMFLMQNYPEPTTAKAIVEKLGEKWMDFEKNRLELLFSRLRKKIKQVTPHSNENPIRALRNKGYQLMIPISNDERQHLR